jgi:general secretion pathway protein F
MSPFRYKALAADGSVINGHIDAMNEIAVATRVREFGLIPLSVSALRENWISGLLPKIDRRQFSYRKLNIACQELTALLSAGVDLERALSILQRLGDLGGLQKAFSAVHIRVREGSTFGDALAAEQFPPFLVSGVRAGEGAGSLEATLRRLSDYIARRVAVNDAVVSSLLYPAILLVVAGFSVLFILVFVLPEFKPLFDEAGRTLPLPTRIVMGFGDLIRDYWWLWILLVGAGIVASWRAVQNPHQRLKIDGGLLLLPVLGRLISGIELERFGRTLGTLVANGVDLASAVPVAKDVIGNRVLRNAVAQSGIGLREGGEFAERLAVSGLIPSVMIDLIRIGEETGHLDEMLLKQADLDEQRIRHSVDRLLALLVPGLTILLGLFVGALIASIVTAILSLNELALPR